MKDVLIPILVVCAMLTAIFIVLAVSDAKRFSDGTGPVWNDDDYDGYGSY